MCRCLAQKPHLTHCKGRAHSEALDFIFSNRTLETARDRHGFEIRPLVEHPKHPTSSASVTENLRQHPYIACQVIDKLKIVSIGASNPGDLISFERVDLHIPSCQMARVHPPPVLIGLHDFAHVGIPCSKPSFTTSELTSSPRYIVAVPEIASRPTSAAAQFWYGMSAHSPQLTEPASQIDRCLRCHHASDCHASNRKLI